MSTPSCTVPLHYSGGSRQPSRTFRSYEGAHGTMIVQHGQIMHKRGEQTTTSGRKLQVGVARQDRIHRTVYDQELRTSEETLQDMSTATRSCVRCLKVTILPVGQLLDELCMFVNNQQVTCPVATRWQNGCGLHAVETWRVTDQGIESHAMKETENWMFFVPYMFHKMQTPIILQDIQVPHKLKWPGMSAHGRQIVRKHIACNKCRSRRTDGNHLQQIEYPVNILKQ
ncbi:hypothetical protein PR048_021545 [Dryococelus australis]|uniref:Uncharacterized protein n=1 Tax=Dryococelus australis TaxID=614101 RepID=A0ABQ9GYH3_9NEOP|nr:hypothetical protein PR048_021545 [Dryococelus australis]